MAGELSSWTDKVAKHSFSMSPDAFTGSLHAAGNCGILAVISVWLSYHLKNSALNTVSALVYLTGSCTLLFEFVFYKSPVDLFFREKRSFNVFAERKAAISSERRHLPESMRKN